MVKYPIRILVSLDSDVGKKLLKKAEDEERSQSSIIRQLLKKNLSRDKDE